MISLRGEVDHCGASVFRLVIVGIAYKRHMQLHVSVPGMKLLTPNLDVLFHLINPWIHRPSAVDHEAQTCLLMFVCCSILNFPAPYTWLIMLIKFCNLGQLHPWAKNQ